MSELSPCQGICDSDRRHPCSGCSRTTSEVKHWGKLPPAMQRTIITRAFDNGMLNSDYLTKYPWLKGREEPTGD